MVKKHPFFPEDSAEYRAEAERCRLEREAWIDTIYKNLALENAEREHQQQEAKKARLKALRTLARIEPLVQEIKQKTLARGRAAVARTENIPGFKMRNDRIGWPEPTLPKPKKG
jgi:hypothetical protein